ncbi:MAG TPA: archaeal proteasome endopeptidase complex subunit beta [Candidatus Deferrimicrobium sp.]|nr:archaeal proteasome endopeptidase complex subunit beta [Candidatus Deferrimicrobium sp.]
MENFYLPGATTIGIRCSNGVVLASEKRLTFGRGIQSKSVKKVFKITENIGIAFAGLVSDFQVLKDTIGAYLNLYKLDEKKDISIAAAAKQTSSLLYTRRIFPFYTNTIMGGIDASGPRIYALDAIGSVIEDEYATTGSGSELAVGVLESEYTPKMTVEDGKRLAIRAIQSAAQRDPTSGEGIDLLVIQKAKVEELTAAIK